MKKVTKKTVVLTGASTGIGRAIAQKFLAQGNTVIVLGLHKPDFCSVFYETDLRDEQAIIQSLSKIKKIDILINNAGVAKVASIVKSSNDLFDELFTINVKGLFWMAKHSIPKLAPQGCIVNISSIAGIKSYASYGLYCATKSAIISLTKTLALELAPQKIRVNCVAPGIVDTAIWQKMYGTSGKKQLALEARSVPLKRFGTAEEIAHAVLFACENTFLNGEVIVVDGGETIV